jgi:predicted ArsR family transcriptional regulator
MSQVLLALRLKGRATADELATSLGVPASEVQEELAAMAAENLAVARPAGDPAGC